MALSIHSSLNILVKLISVVALVIAPLLAGNSGLISSFINSF